MFLYQLIQLILILIFKPKKEDFEIGDKFGLNAFFNTKLFNGSLSEQSNDIRNELGVKHVRVLFHWDNSIQNDKRSKCFFGFYDDILKNLEDDMQALVVLTGVPDWVENEEDKHACFIKYCSEVMERYKDEEKIIGYQIGNEPNSSSFPENVILDLVRNPRNYVRLLHDAYFACKEINYNKKIVSAATTSIVQNYPDTLDYNKEMHKSELWPCCDYIGVHYYGDRDFINFYRPNGIYSFLKGIDFPIWITEIGEEKFNNHLKYARTVIPHLFKKLPNLERIYWYQYDGNGVTERFGIRNSLTDAISGLYNYLRNKIV